MIEFKGEISKECKLYLLKREARALFISAIITVLIVGMPILIVGFVWEKNYLWFLILCFMAFIMFSLPMISLMMPKSREKSINQIHAKVPLKVTISDDIIEVEYEEKYLEATTSEVTKIIDVGDCYILSTRYFQREGYYCACQKDLLTKGTLEEFEELFADKIVRKKKS